MKKKLIGILLTASLILVLGCACDSGNDSVSKENGTEERCEEYGSPYQEYPKLWPDGYSML